VVFGIIVTHGRLGAELLKAAEAIVGTDTGVKVLSSGELAPAKLAEQIHALLREIRSEGNSDVVFLFVDLWGGTCFNVCHRILKEEQRVFLFSGVNLPMLLEFLLYREELELDQFVERIESRGRRGVRRLLPGKPTPRH